MARSAKHFPLFAVIAVLGGLAFTTPVGAVESYGVGAIPAHPREDNPRTKSIFVYEAKPGSVTTDAIKLINNTNEQRTIKVYAVDSQRSSDGAFACAQAVDEKKEVGSWLKLQQNEVILPPGENQEVPFTVTIPNSAIAGEHNGCIAIEDTKAPTQQAGNGIVLSFRSAIRVAVTVPGKIDASLAFTNLFINEQNNKVVASPVLKNTGNVSVDASVNATLTSLFGTVVAQSEGTFVVLNKDESRFNFELERPFWGGWYTLETQAEYSVLRPHPSETDEARTTRGTARTLFIAPHPTAALVYAVGIVVVVGSAAYLIWRRRSFKLIHQSTVAYHVKHGDNLQTLAEHTTVSWRTLAKLNHLKPPYSLHVGQVIRLPGTRPKTSVKSSKKQA